MRASLRFTILTRDRFTCGYCGRGAPDVLLQVDHIVPVSKGGTDDEINLLTACRECNGGKSDTIIENHPRSPLSMQTLLELRERAELARSCAQLVVDVAAAQNALEKEMQDAWERIGGYTAPEIASWVLRAVLAAAPVDEIVLEMQQTKASFPNTPGKRLTRHLEQRLQYLARTWRGEEDE